MSINTVQDFIINLKFNQIPAAVIEKVKLSILDIIGTILAGKSTEISHIMREYTKDVFRGGKDKSTIFGADFKLSPPGAALVNAFTANALDYDDGYRLVKGHPTAVIFPALFALAEREDISGKEFIEAMIVAYEIGLRAGMIWHDFYPVYQGTGSWGSMAAAAGTAKILRLKEKKILNALGVAEFHASNTPMLRSLIDTSMNKDGIGWGAFVGLSSTLMAEKGFVSSPGILQEERYNDLINELGKKYRLLDIYYKPYACCRWAQPAVEGILKNTSGLKISADEISEIQIHTFKEAIELGNKIPKNTEEAQYNLAYPVAAATLYSKVGVAEILRENYDKQEIVTLMDKIEFIHSKEIQDNFPEYCESRTVIHLKSGEILDSGVISARGVGENNLTKVELENKFRELAKESLNEKKIKEIIYFIDHLDEIKRVSTLSLIINGEKEILDFS